MLHIIRRDPYQCGYAQARWTLATLLDHCAWLDLTTLPGLWQLLRRLGIHYKRGREYVHSPDPHYLEKQAWIMARLAEARTDPERIALLYLDEVTFYRQPSVASAYAAKGTDQARAQRSHRSNTHSRVLAAMNALSGQVTYVQQNHITVPALRKFYSTLHETYPQAETLYVVQDNWPVHAHPDVTVVLEKQQYPWWPTTPSNWPQTPSAKLTPDTLPIQLVFLPTYASWCNPIEKLWRRLKQQQLHLHRLSDAWDALKQRVCTFLDQFSTGSTDLLRYTGLLPT